MILDADTKNPEQPVASRCGTIAIVGRPNAGKSTLLNALVGEKLAITHAKPQATREPVIGIVTEAEVQLVFVDQPGLLEPRYLMHEAMRAAAFASCRAADAVLYLQPADVTPHEALVDVIPELEGHRRPVAQVFTKCDRVREPLPAGERDSFWISAAKRTGLDAVLAWCRSVAPIRPFAHASDDISSQPLRFFVSEFVRETAFERLGEELPYSLAAEVDEYREGSDPLYIRVTIYVERESQRRIVIGRRGATVRDIGVKTRKKLETFLQQRVYLDLWVKTLPKWRNSPAALARFGLPVAENKP